MNSFRIGSDTPVYTLGPKGTFSDQAARLYHFSEKQINYSRTFTEALLEISKEPANLAVVPIENSVAGTVSQVQDSLVRDDLVILSEINLPVSYSLLVSTKQEQIQICFAHPQALEQTSNFVTLQLPSVSPQFTQSNIDSGMRFLEHIENTNEAVSAIVPVSFAEKYPQYLHTADIQDYKNNLTRFLLVKKRFQNHHHDFSLLKTALFVEYQEDRPGLLYRLLSVFNLFGINLCKLESRPSKTTPWMYVFYVDFYNSPETETCLEVLRTSHFDFKILGSYDIKNLKSSKK